MADSIRKVEYFKVMISNRTGEGARVLGALKGSGVNLIAFSGFPRGRGVQLDFVPRNGAAFRRAAKKAGLEISGMKSCFLIQGRDRSGAVAAVAGKLAEAGIGITALDAIVAGGGRFGALLWVAPNDMGKAAKALGAS